MNFAKTISLLVADFINDKELYIETNMRPGETKKGKTSISSVPRAPIAVLVSTYLFSVPYYLATRCADVRPWNWPKS